MREVSAGELDFYRRAFAARGFELDVSGVGFRATQEGGPSVLCATYGHKVLMDALAMVCAGPPQATAA